MLTQKLCYIFLQFSGILIYFFQSAIDCILGAEITWNQNGVQFACMCVCTHTLLFVYACVMGMEGEWA